MDVARKLVILAREMGLTLELADVEVESLVPAALRGVDVDEFLKRLSEFDARDGASVARRGRRDGKVLRYVGRVDGRRRGDGGAGDGFARHPFANIASPTTSCGSSPAAIATIR